MARHKAADEAFCRACGQAIKIQAPRCPQCGSSTSSFPGFEPETEQIPQQEGPQSSEPQTEKQADRRESDDLFSESTLDQVSPYIAWSGGVLVVLIGLSTLFSPQSIITGILGGFIIIAAGAFAIPPVREEVRPMLAENGVDTPLSRGAVAAITILGLFLGTMIAAI